jgi:hypothetical protein
MRGWWESSHSSIGYNRKDSSTVPFQPGGCTVISVGQTSHRVIGQGSDTTGLGRWTWTHLRGKYNVTLQVISAYCPCKPSNVGPNTTYTQQKQFFDRNGDAWCPRDALLEDLGRAQTKSF